MIIIMINDNIPSSSAIPDIEKLLYLQNKDALF